MHASMKRFATILCHAPLLVMLRRVGGEEQESKDGEVLMVRYRSVYVQVYVLYNIPNILSSTATTTTLAELLLMDMSYILGL